MDYRNYDNALGRFSSMDILAELAPSITPYRFAFNNPVYWSDSTGLFEENSNYLAICPTCPNTPEFQPFIDDPNILYSYDPETETITQLTPEEIETVYVEAKRTIRNWFYIGNWFYLEEGFVLWGQNRYGDFGGWRNGNRVHSIETSQIPTGFGKSRNSTGTKGFWDWLINWWNNKSNTVSRVQTIKAIIENSNTSTIEVQNIEPVVPPALEVIVRVYALDTINLSGKYLVTSHKDIITSSQAQIDSLHNINDKFKTDYNIWLNHVNNLNK